MVHRGTTSERDLAQSLIRVAACREREAALAQAFEILESHYGCTSASFREAAGEQALESSESEAGELSLELSHAGRPLGWLVARWEPGEALPSSSDWGLEALGSALGAALAHAQTLDDTRRRERRLRAIFDNTNSVVFIKDLDGRYLLVNPQLLELTGFSREQIVGKTDHELFEPEAAARIVANDRQVLDSGMRGEFEGVTEFPAGPRVFLTTKFPLRDEQGQVYALCGISRDITERKRIERTKQLDALGRLAQGIAHDFNNVLMSVQVSGELIDELVPAPRARTIDTALEAISESCERAADLTARLLQFSSQAHRPRKVIELHTVIEGVVRLLGSGNRSAKISTQLDAGDARVHGDAGQLQAAVLQLGLNARDALEGSGSIVFSTRELELSRAECENSSFALRPGTYVELEIRDTGTGINPELLPRIFEPFFTTKRVGEGAGLGLAAVHGTVVSHGASIDVHSRVGEGTRVLVRLPKAPGQSVEEAAQSVEARPRAVAAESGVAEPAAALPAAAAPLGGQGMILFIDDEPAVRRTVKLQLESLGFEVRIACDGFEGIEMFSAHHEQLCAVILDMVMPKLGGAAAYARMREIDADVPVIVCSGYVPGEDMKALQREGIAGFLGKPYRRAQLRSELDRVLARA